MATTIQEQMPSGALTQPVESLQHNAATPPASPMSSWLSEFELKVAQDFQRRTKLDYKQTIQQIIENAAPQPGMHVLDVATGTGVIARQFVGRVGERGKIVGCDNAAQIEQAKLDALSAKVSSKLEWRVAQADKLPFDDHSFDLVICAMAFHRLPAVAFLAAAHRVLKPGGRLLIADELAPVEPSAWRKTLRRAYYQYIVRDSVEAEAQFYQAEQLQQMLRAAGFQQQIIKVLRQRSKHDWAFSLINAVK